MYYYSDEENKMLRSNKKELRNYIKKRFVGKKPKTMELTRNVFFDPSTKFDLQDLDSFMSTIIFLEDIAEGYDQINSMFGVDIDLDDIDYKNCKNSKRKYW